MNPIKKLREKSGSRIIENTIMLAILYFSNFAIAFVLTAYQSRVFGASADTVFGILGVAAAVRSLFQLFIDFGFILSATGKIAKHRDDKEYVEKMLTSVTISKSIFIGISMVVMGFYIHFRIGSSTEAFVYWMYLLSTGFMSLLPDYLYRGYEKMSIVTVRAVSIKIFSTIMIFVFMKSPADYWMIPFFEALGNFGAIFAVYGHLFKKMDIHFRRVSVSDVKKTIKDSSQFFFSRIASTIYGSANVFVLTWFVDPTKEMSGYYSNANKIIEAARLGVVSPVADSMYPHMMKTKNFKVIKKALKITFPILLAGCAFVWIFAEPIAKLWLADYGANIVLPLRALMPVVLISLPNYILGFPTLSPMGLVKHANRSITVGTIVHVIALAALVFSDTISMLSICILTCCTEFVVMSYRVIVIFKNRHIFKQEAELADKEATQKAKLEAVPVNVASNGALEDEIDETLELIADDLLDSKEDEKL